MDENLKIGFIGFGEAGFHIASGLRSRGVEQIVAYDINRHTPGLGQKIELRAQTSSVRLVESNAELAAGCDVLLATVTANRATEAAEQTAPFLLARHTYADLNSISPALKQSIEKTIQERGARFVEA